MMAPAFHSSTRRDPSHPIEHGDAMIARPAPFIASLLIIACAIQSVHSRPATKARYAGWKPFEGAWFEISYPPGFTPRPSKKSATSERGCDSAFFLSPDKLVEFYVFSPQWSGEPDDIRLDPATETVASHKQERTDGRTTRWVEIRSKNRAYLRAYADTVDETRNTRLVFGIKYRDERAYGRYKDTYLAFKQSLVQFAD